MEILGIGMPELVFIVVIALIVLGPKDMQKAGKTIGKFLRNLVTSDGWRAFQQTSREIRTLPTRLMREANDELSELNKIGNKIGNEINASDPTRAGYHSVSTPPRATPPSPVSTASSNEESDSPEPDSNKPSIDNQDKNA